MSKYTFTLRELVSTFGEDEVKSWFMDWELSDYLTPEEITVINERGVWSKEQLANRIVKHYFLREVGTDAVGSFQLFARDLMAELMETYAPLIYSSSIKFDPLVNVDYTESYQSEREGHGNTESNSRTDTSGLSVNSDTPQGQINKSAILQGNYASSTGANENESTMNDETSTRSSGNEHYVKKIKGNSGVTATAQALIKQYREYIKALNTEIVYQLEPLFLGIY